MFYSKITVGDGSSQQECATEVTDGGWYECKTNRLPPGIEGSVIKIERTKPDNDEWYNLSMIRAYSGQNVAQYAEVFAEPSDHASDEGASLLLKMSPRTN